MVQAGCDSSIYWQDDTVPHAEVSLVAVSVALTHVFFMIIRLRRQVVATTRGDTYYLFSRLSTTSAVLQGQEDRHPLFILLFCLPFNKTFCIWASRSCWGASWCLPLRWMPVRRRHLSLNVIAAAFMLLLYLPRWRTVCFTCGIYLLLLLFGYSVYSFCLLCVPGD